MKPKIALITDTDNWAFYNRAVILSEKLKDCYEFKIIPATTALQENVLQTILLVQDCDLVHFFWRGLLFSLDNENVILKSSFLDTSEDKEVFIKELISKYEKEHNLTMCRNRKDMESMVKYIKKEVNVSNIVLAEILQLSKSTIVNYLKS